MNGHRRSIAKHGYEMNVPFWMNLFCFFFFIFNFPFNFNAFDVLAYNTFNYAEPRLEW